MLAIVTAAHTMLILIWTPHLVAAHLSDAARSLQLSHPWDIGSFEDWLEIIGRRTRTPVAADNSHTSSDTSSGDARNSALIWLRWLDGEERTIAWKRANGRPWKAIAHDHGMDRSTAWRRWTNAMVLIAARLNAENDATRLQQHNATPMQSDALPSPK